MRIFWSFEAFLFTSLTVGALIFALWLLSPMMRKRYAASWRVLCWCLLALRLLLPFDISLPQAPIRLEAPTVTISVPRPSSPSSQGIHSSVQTEPAKPLPQVSLPEHPTAQEIPLVDLAAMLWGAGAVAAGILTAARYFVYRKRILRWARLPRKEGLLQVWQTLDPPKSLRLLISGAAPGPMLIGFWKPILVLPDENGDVRAWMLILRHELTHHRRGDLWLKLFWTAAVCLHWFNPLVWLMRRAAAADLELRCDDGVIASADFTVRRQYGEMLVDSLARKGASTPLSTYFREGRESMMLRLSNIIKPGQKRSAVWISTLLVSLLLLAGTLVACKQREIPIENESEGHKSNVDSSAVFEPQPELPKDSIFFEAMPNVNHYRYALIEEEDGTFWYGLADSNNKILLEPKWGSLSYLTDDRFLVYEFPAAGNNSGLWYLIDKNGELIGETYDQIIFEVSYNALNRKGLVGSGEQDGIYSLFDLSGEVLADGYDWIAAYNDIEETPIYAVKGNDGYRLAADGKVLETYKAGITDKNKNYQIYERYVPYNLYLSSLYGVQDLAGNEILPPDYPRITTLSDERMVVFSGSMQALEETQAMLVDATGQPLSESYNWIEYEKAGDMLYGYGTRASFNENGVYTEQHYLLDGDGNALFDGQAYDRITLDAENLRIDAQVGDLVYTYSWGGSRPIQIASGTPLATVELTEKNARSLIEDTLSSLVLYDDGSLQFRIPDLLPGDPERKTDLYISMNLTYSDGGGSYTVVPLLEFANGWQPGDAFIHESDRTEGLLKVMLWVGYMTTLNGEDYSTYAADYIELTAPFSYGSAAEYQSTSAKPTGSGVTFTSKIGEKIPIAMELPRGVTLSAVELDDGTGEFPSVEVQKNGEAIGAMTLISYGTPDREALALIDLTSDELPMQVYAPIALSNHADYHSGYKVVASTRTGSNAVCRMRYQDLSGSYDAAANVPWQERDCVMAFDLQSAPYFLLITLEANALTEGELEMLAKSIAFPAHR